MRSTRIPLSRTIHSLTAAVAVAVLALPGAARAQDAAAEMQAAVEKQNARMVQAHNAGDAAGIAALYAKDAILMPPNSEAVTGREAIGALWASYLSSGMQVSLTTKSILVGGDYAIDTGVYGLTAPDGSHVDHGNYVAVWKKTSDGMMMVRDIWNTNMAPAN